MAFLKSILVFSVSLGCIFFSCKSNNVTNDLIEARVIEYLKKYDDSFTIHRIHNSTAPGDKEPTYDVYLISDKYDRVDFSVGVKVIDSQIIIRYDKYPLVLISQAYLDKLQFTGFNDIFATHEITIEDIDMEEIKSISSLQEAATYISETKNIKWMDVLLVHNADLKNKLNILEDLVVDYCEKSHKVNPGRHEVSVFFYPSNLNREKLTFEKPKPHNSLCPNVDEVQAEWIILWNERALKKVKNSFQELVKKRRNIPH